MTEEKFIETCDFNICEEEKEEDLGNYRAIFYSESTMEIKNPEKNNWAYSNLIKQEFLNIINKRKEEFESNEKYDYEAEVIILYKITDKTSGISSKDMQHNVKRFSKNKEELEKGVNEISSQLNNTFKQKVVIMYDYNIYNITLDCYFYVI